MPSQDVITLREHFEALRTADQEALRVTFEANQRALDLARERQDARDEAANELRSQIERERGSYMTMDEYTRQHQSLRDLHDADVRALDNRITALGKQVALTAVGALVSFTLLLVGVLFNLLTRL